MTARCCTHLVDKVGADRVVLGSDYPVGETKPIEFVRDTDGIVRHAEGPDRFDQCGDAARLRINGDELKHHRAASAVCSLPLVEGCRVTVAVQR